MAITIVATAGETNANSFVTAAEMTTYCNARLNASAWTAADAQLPALVEATRDLNLPAYIGGKATVAQALMWPRVWAVDPDASSVLVDPVDPSRIAGSFVAYFSETAIPQRVKDATCELALQYLKAGTTDMAALDDTLGVIRETVDVLTTEYAKPGERAQGLARFPRVMALIAPLLDRTRSGGLTVIRS